jgi:adenylate kinase
METQSFVFFGIVGSGKGTQINLLIDYLKSTTGKDSVYAYPGNEYRKLISGESLTGKLVKDSLEKGELQPDFLTNSIFSNILIQELDNEKHLVADGYPRTISQAESLEDMMNFYQRKNIKMIYIEVSKEEAMKRNLLRGRSDDTEEGILKRFNEYVNKVVPSMNYFKDKEGYEIFHINGEQSVEDVHRDILKALNFN